MTVSAAAILIAFQIAAASPSPVSESRPAVQDAKNVSRHDEGASALRWQFAQAAGGQAQPADGAGEDQDDLLQAEQKRSAALAEKLADLQRSTAAQIDRLQQQLETEQAQAASRELAAARELLAQADRMRTSEDSARQPLDATIKQRDAKLQDEEKRSAALTQQVVDLRRTTSAQLEVLKTQLAEERGRSATQSRDLTAARDQGNSAAQDRSRETAARQALEAEVESGTKSLQAATAQIEEMKKQLTDQQVQVAGRDRDLAAARDQLAQASKTRTSGDQDRQSLQAALGDKDLKIKAAQARNDELAAELVQSKQTAAVQVKGLTKQIADWQAQSAGRGQDAASLRAQLAQVHNEQASENAARLSAETAVRERDKQIQAAQNQVTASANQLTRAQHDAAATVATSQKRVEDEKSKTDQAGRDLAMVRAQMADAARASAEAVQARLTAEATAKDADAKLRTEQMNVTALTQRLAETSRKTEAQVAMLAGQIAAERLQSSRATASLDEASGTEAPRSSADRTHLQQKVTAMPSPPRQEAVALTRDQGIAKQSDALPSPTGMLSEQHPEPVVSPGADANLPTGAIARVVLRYRRASDAARRHAMTLRSTLQAKGLDVAEPVEATRGEAVSRVTYFYGEDRNTAQDVAEKLALSAPVENRRASNPLPRPGTIEVLVGG